MTFPIDQMPAPIQAVTYLVFARYYVTISEGRVPQGRGHPRAEGADLAMFVYAAVVAWLAARGFRKRLD